MSLGLEKTWTGWRMGRAQEVPPGNLSEQGRRREKMELSLENFRLFIHSSIQQLLMTCQALC